MKSLAGTNVNAYFFTRYRGDCCRGGVLRGFLNNYRPLKAIIFSGLLFGITHFYPPQVINAAIFGVVLGFIYFSTKSLLLCMVVHSLHNSLALLSHFGKVDFGLVTFLLGLVLFAIPLWFLSRSGDLPGICAVRDIMPDAKRMTLRKY